MEVNSSQELIFFERVTLTTSLFTGKLERQRDAAGLHLGRTQVRGVSAAVPPAPGSVAGSVSGQAVSPSAR